MPSVDTASQAGIYDSKMIANYVLNLAEKCAALQREFSACSESFSHGRRQINQAEEMMESMQASLAQFNGTLDGLGDQALQVRTTAAQRNTKLEKLRRDVARREDLLQKLQEQALKANNENTDSLQMNIRKDRLNLDQQLHKVNRDIDCTSETLFEVEDKLEKLKELHAQRKQADKEKLLALQRESVDIELQRRHVLSTRNGNVLRLTSLYASPSENSKLQTEVNELKLKQANMDQNIQMLLDERQLLRDTANQVIEKVHNLEMKVRKETGDHGYNSYTTADPNWYQDRGTRSIWPAPKPLSIDQIKRLSDRHTRKYLPAPEVEAINDSPSSDDGQQLTIVHLNES